LKHLNGILPPAEWFAHFQKVPTSDRVCFKCTSVSDLAASTTASSSSTSADAALVGVTVSLWSGVGVAAFRNLDNVVCHLCSLVTVQNYRIGLTAINVKK